MRVLLAQNMLYLPAYGGANRSNRILLEDLAARGHGCRAVAPMSGAAQRTSTEAFAASLERRGITPRAVTPDAVVFTHREVEVHAVVEPSRLPGHVARLAANADWTLVPSDDPGQLVLAAAQHASPGRVVYLAYTLQHLPFGPRSFAASQAGTRLVRRAASVVAISRAAQDYLRRWGRSPRRCCTRMCTGRVRTRAMDGRMSARSPWSTPARSRASPCSSPSPTAIPRCHSWP